MSKSPNYEDFLASKFDKIEDAGFKIEREQLHPVLHEWQKDIVAWALRKGRCALFTDTGTGKTPMQLEWARLVKEKTGGMVLILTPMAVAEQTIAMAQKMMALKVTFAMSGDICKEPGIYITNYEKLHHFDASEFAAVILDESSILKHEDSATRKLITESFAETPYKLACTATPAPNDYMELGNHSEFLGILTMSEMLASYFVHDGGETQKWRLKGHAESIFWKWLGKWAICLRKPSDLGYSDKGYKLPKLTVHKHIVKGGDMDIQEGYLLALPAATLQERQAARRGSIDERIAKVAEIVGDSKDSWLCWCKLNDESEKTAKAIKATEVTGSQPSALKSSHMLDFAAGEIKRLVSKASICGFGMNWQECHNVVFVGMDDSYESYYQAIRRCWRYGQKKPVHVHLVISDMEEAVLRNIEKKEAAAQAMMSKMIAGMSEITLAEIKGTTKQRDLYMTDSNHTENFTMHLGDCVEISKSLPNDSVHYSIFSPPFASLYTYSASERDMGNCTDDAEFEAHFDFLIPELFRVLKPGRLVSFHCMNIPTVKSREGYIGIRDFRGDLIRTFQRHGFIFHSEVVIWKDPLVAMQRTKARGLLHGALVKDSAISRQGIPDYLITMRKPGDNPEPITHGTGFDKFIGEPEFEPRDEKTTNAKTNKYGHYVWQKYASPVWMDIDPGKTLQFRSVREAADEKHICPLQLQVIERGLELWSNPGDLVLSPFAGIGSEGYCALRMGRRFVGIELAKKYYDQACANLKRVEDEKAMDLFAPKAEADPIPEKPKRERKPKAAPTDTPATLFA